MSMIGRDEKSKFHGSLNSPLCSCVLDFHVARFIVNATRSLVVNG
jgi:hypothetical protein